MSGRARADPVAAIVVDVTAELVEPPPDLERARDAPLAVVAVLLDEDESTSALSVAATATPAGADRTSFV